MKKKLLNLLLVLILLVSIPGSIILASDISGALYRMSIVVSNNGTLANYVSTNSTGISTPNLIAGSFLNASANNCAVRNAADSDVPFMPGYSTNPWAFWVETIGADSYLNYGLYTADTTGGTIAYFPDTTGMIVSDNATLELGNDFEVNTAGWFNTADSNFTYPYQKRDAGAEAITDTDEISGIIYLEEPVEISPVALLAWTDIDISEYVPAHATGAVVHLYTSIGGAGAENIGVRINGCVQNFVGDVRGHTWTMVGIDVNDVLEGYVETATCHIYLVGFTGSGVTYKVVADDISLAVAAAWTDIDISVEAPDAIGAIIAVEETAGAIQWGVRKKGSADNRSHANNALDLNYAIIGCDNAQIFEGTIQNLTVDFYLVGYITADFTFNTTGTDKSLVAGFAAWTDIDCSGDVPTGTTHIIFEVKAPAVDYGFRRNGSAEDIRPDCWEHYWVVVECDSDYIVEMWAEDNTVDCWIIGYTQGYTDSPYDDAVIAASVTPNEYTINHSLNANAFDFSVYSANTTIAVSMGGGLIPVFLLEEQELLADTGSVTFSNIDALVANWDTYAGVTSRHLVVIVNAHQTGGVSNTQLRMQLNSDGGNNYNYQHLLGSAAAASAGRTDATAYFITGYINGTDYADAFSGVSLLIPHAFNTTNHKSILSFGGSVEEIVSGFTGRWADNSAIDTMLLYPHINSFASGSTFWLGVVDERYLVEEDLLAAPSTIDFAGISGDGHDLAVIGYGRGTLGAAEDELEIEFNADGGGATSFTQRLLGTGAVTSAATANNNLIGWIPGDNATANAFGAFVGFISQYAETTNDPHYLTLNGYHETVGPTSRVGVYSGRWNNVAAVTQVEFYGNGAANLATGTLFSLYQVPRTVIDRQELTAPAATITFNNIPQGYEALQLLIYTRSDAVAINDLTYISYNTDVVNANYDMQLVQGDGVVVSAARSAATRVVAYVPAATEGGNQFAGGTITIFNYAKADRNKSFFGLLGNDENRALLRSMRWENSNAISRIDLTLGAGNFIAGTIIELVGIFPQDVHAIEVDGDLYGISDGNNLTVPDVTLDWEYCLKYAMPYLYSANTSVSGTPVSAWEWEYNNIFQDSIGANDATPSFRTASSDADVVATAVSFQPIEEAKAPGWTLSANTSTWYGAANVTGNFTTTPSPTYPGADVIEDMAAASGTPAQLPFTIILGFIILAVSLSISSVLRTHGSRSLVVKIIVVGGLLGIGEAVRIVDFWMVLFFLILAFAILAASKPGEAV